MEITAKEAARLAGITARHIRHLVRSGKVSGRKERNPGKPGPTTWRVDRDSLLQYIESTKEVK